MKFLITVLLVGSSLTAFAQSARVGTLENVQGVVSLSSNGVVSSVKGDTDLSDGNVVLNSDTGSSFVHMDNGCSVALKANQFLTINSKDTCSALLASVKTVGAPVVAGGAPTVNPFLIAGGVVAGAVLIRNATKDKASGS